MRLSTYSDYAFRVLIYVGCSKEISTISRISEAYDISKDHLRKVVNHLSNLGYLKTTQGRNGGITLAQEPGQIMLGDVTRELENLNLVECFNEETNGCPIIGMCALNPILLQAQNRFMDSLNEFSLAALIKGKNLREFCNTQKD